MGVDRSGSEGRLMSLFRAEPAIYAMTLGCPPTCSIVPGFR